MDSSGKNSKSDLKDKIENSQGLSQNKAKPEHHLTSDTYIRVRGHLSEEKTHCPKKDTNMPETDIHEKINEKK